MISRSSDSTIHKTGKAGFSLIELLVVIAIIGVLAGALLATMSGGTEAARSAACLANLKNLASACQTYGMANDYYPLAGNRVKLTIDESRGVNNILKTYTETPGWVSTMTKGMYPGKSYSKAQAVSMYTEDEEQAQYALTNGALWKYVSQNGAAYVCPAHARKFKNAQKPKWSYLMSAYFGWDNAGRVCANPGVIPFGSLERADKILLFSEIPFSGHNDWSPAGEGGKEEDTDAVLQYSSTGAVGSRASAGAGGDEEIGVNHAKGKNSLFHVAFADGHVEQLIAPDSSKMKQLTSWLATGVDVFYENGDYKKVEQ